MASNSNGFVMISDKTVLTQKFEKILVFPKKIAIFKFLCKNSNFLYKNCNFFGKNLYNPSGGKFPWSRTYGPKMALSFIESG
jgi:hypothetical protein